MILTIRNLSVKGKHRVRQLSARLEDVEFFFEGGEGFVAGGEGGAAEGRPALRRDKSGKRETPRRRTGIEDAEVSRFQRRARLNPDGTSWPP